MGSVYQIIFAVFVIGILLNVSNQNRVFAADSYSQVKFLPGFRGPLPFRLETGYVGVDESEDVQLFYYFVESERNPREDPVILWMTGGPGCSSFTGLAYEIGPVNFEQVEYNGTLPTLVYNPNTWTKTASIIFLDLPVGTGFSYSRTSVASSSTDSQACDQAVQFLRKGYLAGNPFTFPAQSNFSISFAHGMGLISDELYESLRRSCGLDEQKADPDTAECSHGLENFKQLTDGLNQQQILENNCGEDSPQLRRSLSGGKRAVMAGFGETSLSVFKCRVDGRWLSAYWFNDACVQKALHIRKGTIGTWVRCNRDNLAFEMLIWDVRPHHANLSRKGYRSLVYSGDHDFLIPFQSTQAWIRGLNYSIIDEWRPWTLEGQIAGYTRTYSNKMTFATVKGGGHTAPEYRPAECYAMFERWMSHKPL